MKRRYLLLNVMILFFAVCSYSAEVVADFTDKKLPSVSWQTSNTAYQTDRCGESAPSLQIKKEGYLLTEKITNLNEISFVCTRSSGGTNFKVQYSTNLVDFVDIATYSKNDIAQYSSSVGTMTPIRLSDLSHIDSSQGVFIRFYSVASSYYIDDVTITYGEASETEQSLQPTISPIDGTIFGNEGLNVTLTAADGASIYYNINADVDPDADNAMLYDGEGIFITETSTIKAIAIEQGKEPSDVVSATYTYVEPGYETTAIFYVENAQNLPTADYSFMLPTGSATSTNSLCGVNDLIAGDVQAEFTKGGNNYTYSDGDKVRFYKESTLKLTPTNNVLIKRIELRRKGETGEFTLLTNKGEITNNETSSGSLNAWEGLSDSHVLLSNTGQIRFDYILVTYERVNPEVTLNKPVITVVEGIVDEKNCFYEPIKVAVECATREAVVEYRFDETSEWIAYAEPITIDKTTTIYAKASLSELTEETFAQFTLVEPGDETTAIFYVENAQNLPIADYSFLLPTGSDSSTNSLCGVKDMIAGDVQAEFTKGVSNYTYSDGDKVRFYKESTLKLTPTNNVLIKRIELRRKGETGEFTLLTNKGEITNNETSSGSLNAWEGLSDSYVLLSNTGQIRFDYILVTYEGVKPEVALDKPVITVVEGIADAKNRFSEPIKVAVECATPDAVVEYRFDETSEWIAYAEPITIDKTTSIYAKASLSELTEETFAQFTLFKSQIASIEELRTFGPQEESVLSEEGELTEKKETFTFDCPLYVVAQKGERLFVTDQSDNFYNGLLIMLKGNAADDKSFGRGDIIPAGVKGYYANIKGLVPQLCIDQYDATLEGNTADAQCYLPETDGTVVIAPLNVNVEDVLLVETDNDYRYMSKFICASYSWFDLENMTISIPVEDGTLSESYLPKRVLTAGDVTVDILNLFEIELPSQSGLASITGVLDYSVERGAVVYMPLSFGIATSVENIERADAIRVEGRSLIVPDGAVVYNLSGIKVNPNNLAPGIYIVRHADSIAKIRIF